MLDLLLKQLNDTSQHYRIDCLIEDQTLRTAFRTMLEGVRNQEEHCYSDFHQLLAMLNKYRLSINGFCSPAFEQLANTCCTLLEQEWLTHERAVIRERLGKVPLEPRDFVDWFENLEQTGYGQHHPLFLYLAERANAAELRYFLKQELATEAGFDDLVALTQVKTPLRVKMELARNYWDEMGDGNRDDVHSLLLANVAKSLNLDLDGDLDGIHWQPLALSNLMVAFAKNRSLFYQSIGALGVIELTAPGRCTKVTEGLRRNGLDSSQIQYYALHSSLDVEHWQGWKENVMYPLLQENPACMTALAEGALLRLLAGNRCFEVYFRQMQARSFAAPHQTVVPA